MNARRFGILVVLWSVPAFLMVMQMQASAFAENRPFYRLPAMIPALAEWLVWVPVTPLVLALADRFPVWPRVSARSVAVHACGVVAATLLRALIYSTATFAFGSLPAMPFPQYFMRISIGWLPSAALVYGVLVTAGVAFHYSREASIGAVRSAELESALARAESASIRAQLDPHFLFNSLHSVGALVRAHDGGAAIQMLSDIGELLRESFARRGVEWGGLQDEIAFARRYLAIEQVRFRDRLAIRWEVEGDSADAVVPRSLLQPIVENAIRHGIAKRSAAGRITIAARRVGNLLHLSVSDDGPGFNGTEAAAEGVGLSATRMRLFWLYGDAASLALSSDSGNGARVEITLPYRSA